MPPPVEPAHLAATLLPPQDGAEYTAFRQRVPVVGVWDDHDFGMNNGGLQYGNKVAAQRLFLDFLDEAGPLARSAPTAPQRGRDARPDSPATALGAYRRA